MEIISPNTPPKVYRSASKRFNSLSFAEKCYHIMNYLHSPESDKVYPFFITHKWDRKNFRKRTEPFRWDECRQKLLHFYKDQFGLVRYKFSLSQRIHGCTLMCTTKLYIVSNYNLVYNQEFHLSVQPSIKP